MAKFLVKRRMDLGTIYPAGSIVDDTKDHLPDKALLIERNYLIPVSDDFTGESDRRSEESSSSRGASVDEPSPPVTAPPAEGAGSGQAGEGTPSKAELPKVVDLSSVPDEPTPADDQPPADNQPSADKA